MISGVKDDPFRIAVPALFFVMLCNAVFIVAGGCWMFVQIRYVPPFMVWMAGVDAVSASALGLIWFRQRRARRVRAGLCPRCAYNLTGNVSGVCPECGAPVVRLL